MDKSKFTSYKISKKLAELGYEPNTQHYWIKTQDATRPKFKYCEGEFFVLPRTKVYGAYDLGTLLEVFGDNFRLEGNQIEVLGATTGRSPEESIVDMVARILISFLESEKIIKG